MKSFLRRMSTCSAFVVYLFLAIAVVAQKPGEAHTVLTAPINESCRVKISWRAETETNAFGYLVFRGTKAGDLKCLNESNPLHAGGTTTIPAQYRYYDRTVACGTHYFYRVAAIDLDGTRDWIIGDQKPVEVTAKPLTAEEQKEIEAHGDSFRIEDAAADPSEKKSGPSLSPR